MLEYVLNAESTNDEPMEIRGPGWDKDTLKQLREEYNIVFSTNGSGIIPIMILDKDGYCPRLVLGSEDDGSIFFEKKRGSFQNTIPLYWVNSLISDLQEALKLCEHKKKQLN